MSTIIKTKTIKSYHQTLVLLSKYLEEELEITDIKKVNKKVVEDYLAFTKEISDVTISGYLRNIKAFLIYAEGNNLVKKLTFIL